MREDICYNPVVKKKEGIVRVRPGFRMTIPEGCGLYTEYIYY
jgi:hypothetical protein